MPKTPSAGLDLTHKPQQPANTTQSQLPLDPLEFDLSPAVEPGQTVRTLSNNGKTRWSKDGNVPKSKLKVSSRGTSSTPKRKKKKSDKRAAKRFAKL